MCTQCYHHGFQDEVQIFSLKKLEPASLQHLYSKESNIRWLDWHDWMNYLLNFSLQLTVSFFSIMINLTIIFTINQLIKNCKIIVKKRLTTISKSPKWRLQMLLLFSSFSKINDQEKWQIFLVKKPEPVNVEHVCLENDNWWWRWWWLNNY